MQDSKSRKRRVRNKIANEVNYDLNNQRSVRKKYEKEEVDLEKELNRITDEIEEESLDDPEFQEIEKKPNSVQEQEMYINKKVNQDPRYPKLNKKSEDVNSSINLLSDQDKLRNLVQGREDARFRSERQVEQLELKRRLKEYIDDRRSTNPNYNYEDGDTIGYNDNLHQEIENFNSEQNEMGITIDERRNEGKPYKPLRITKSLAKMLVDQNNQLKSLTKTLHQIKSVLGI